MNEIKILRVPDEQIPEVYNGHLDEGTLMVLEDGLMICNIIPPDQQPALLAALLEGAGAERHLLSLSESESIEHHTDEGRFLYLYEFDSENKYDEVWVLPTPEEMI